MSVTGTYDLIGNNGGERTIQEFKVTLKSNKQTSLIQEKFFLGYGAANVKKVKLYIGKAK